MAYKIEVVIVCKKCNMSNKLRVKLGQKMNNQWGPLFIKELTRFYLMIWGYAEFKTLFQCIKVGRKILSAILSQNWGEDFRMPSIRRRF